MNQDNISLLNSNESQAQLEKELFEKLFKLKHVILEGKKSCGKSSISMNYAHFLSEQYLSASRSSLSSSSICTVLYVLPATKKNNFYFPMPFLKSLPLDENMDMSEVSLWNENALKAIQIKYIKQDIQSLLHLIGSIPIFLKNDIPNVGIIIEDLHCYFFKNENVGDVVLSDSGLHQRTPVQLNNEEMRKLFQVYSILINTCNHISMHGNNSTIRTFCTISSQMMPFYGRTILDNYSVSFASIQKSNNKLKDEYAVAITESEHQGKFHFSINSDSNYICSRSV